MKALTLTQPWATLVAIGAKRIETRSWSTRYRGPLAIHAAQGLGPVGGKAGLRDLCAVTPFHAALAGHIPSVLGNLCVGDLPRGAIVAVTRLADVVQFGPAKLYTDDPAVAAREAAFGNFADGRFGWLLEDVRPVDPPVPAAGALGLWNVPPVVLAQLGGP